MDQLHAYWRMPYIEAPKPENEGGNPFTRIPASDDDQANYLIWRGEHSFLVMNKFPYNAGHLLAAPYREVPMLAELTSDERADLMDAIILGQQILTDAIQPDGFNVGFNFGHAAGAGIPQHLHCHIVPRWSGDTNFMPVLGETKVLPESMDAMWRRLRECTPAHA